MPYNIQYKFLTRTRPAFRVRLAAAARYWAPVALILALAVAPLAYSLHRADRAAAALTKCMEAHGGK